MNLRSPWVIAAALLWVTVSSYFWLQYAAQSHLQVMDVDQFKQSGGATGWYRLSGGCLDYDHAQGYETTVRTRRTRTEITWDSFVPYVDPRTKAVVALINIHGESSAPSVLRSIGTSEKPVTIEGTIGTIRYSQSRVDSLFENRQLHGLPAIRMGDGPNARTATAITCLFGLLFIMTLFRPGPGSYTGHSVQV